VPEFVRVEGVEPEGQKNIQQSLRNFVGKPLDTKALDHVLTRLTASAVTTASPIPSSPTAARAVSPSASTKNLRAPVLQPFVEINGSEPQDVDFAMGARITAMDVWATAPNGAPT